eukprot:scaffold80447_cov21-Tisochrysis_lutea.AAC.1
MKGDNVQELINKQAEWSEETKNFDGAAEMYIKVRLSLEHSPSLSFEEREMIDVVMQCRQHMRQRDWMAAAP